MSPFGGNVIGLVLGAGTSTLGHHPGFRGREVSNTGDGFLAMFDGPQRAIRCAMSIRDAVQALGIEVRAGLRTGECQVRGDDIGGIGVHIGARVSALRGRTMFLYPARCATL
jgi:class 3 adenylate cyclase